MCASERDHRGALMNIYLWRANNFNQIHNFRVRLRAEILNYKFYSLLRAINSAAAAAKSVSLRVFMLSENRFMAHSPRPKTQDKKLPGDTKHLKHETAREALIPQRAICCADLLPLD